MIHRYIYDELTKGITAARENTKILDELFAENYMLEPDELSAVKEYFLAKGLNVYSGYPRINTAFPAVNIILSGEAEVQEVIGDSGGIIEDEEDPDFGNELRASIWEHEYRLIVTTEHPDVTAYCYELIKFIMLEGIRKLMEIGCFGAHFSGAELIPNPQYAPEHLFSRQLVVKCQREFQRVDAAIRAIRITRVDGIYVDKTNSMHDVGDVKTNVKPY